VREIRTLGLMRRGLETGLWWRYWGTPVRKRGATDRRNLRSRASPRPYLRMKESYKKGESESILAPSLAAGIARCQLKRR